MMNDFELQWNVLEDANHLGGRLRVYPDHTLDFFIDYSLSGNKELVIEAKEILFKFPELPFFENLEVIFDQTSNASRIGLTLIDEALFKSFSVMCFDIAERSQKGKTTEAAFYIATDCLLDWADLFKRRGKVGLTRNEVIGLWGELVILKSLLQGGVGGDELIVQGWRGPNGDQRDIGFNKTRIEVKTQLATKAIGLRISSLDQLDDEGGKLNVILNRISPSEHGISVVELTESIFEMINTNRFANSEFERKLMLAEMTKEQAACHEKFAMDEQLIYEVSDSFPKLTLSNVPLGIKSAEYEISGSAISAYLITWEQLIGDLND